MDTHIRWKVKRRIRDAQITLAVILLFVTSQASSGKMRRRDLWIQFGAALHWKVFLFGYSGSLCCPPPLLPLNSSLCLYWCLNVFSLVCPKPWDLSKYQKTACFWEKAFSLEKLATYSVCQKHPIADKYRCRPEYINILMACCGKTSMHEIVKGYCTVCLWITKKMSFSDVTLRYPILFCILQTSFCVVRVTLLWCSSRKFKEAFPVAFLVLFFHWWERDEHNFH